MCRFLAASSNRILGDCSRQLHYRQAYRNSYWLHRPASHARLIALPGVRQLGFALLVGSYWRQRAPSSYPKQIIGRSFHCSPKCHLIYSVHNDERCLILAEGRVSSSCFVFATTLCSRASCSCYNTDSSSRMSRNQHPNSAFVISNTKNETRKILKPHTQTSCSRGSHTTTSTPTLMPAAAPFRILRV